MTDLNGEPVAPDNNVFLVQYPDGTSDEFAANATGPGVYTADVLLPQSGYTYFRYEGSGTYIAVFDLAIQVSTSPFYPQYPG